MSHLVDRWAELPLAPGGRCLIEASAGTGKTWTISVLYLRLLLEQDLGPTRIVVTTFTEAAAEELRERLRGRLLWALDRAGRAVAGERFEIAGDTPPDAAWLFARWADGGDAPRADLRRLRLALADLDLAPVGTLHGLCRRILGEYPFECGATFGLGEMIASDALDDELIDDLWRELAQSPGELEPGAAAWFEGGRAGLGWALKRVTRAGIGVRAIDPAVIADIMDPAHVQPLREWLGGLRFAPRRSALKNAIAGLADFIEAGDPMAALPTRIPDNLDKPPDEQLADAEQAAAVLASDEFVFCRYAVAVLKHAAAPAKSAALIAFRARLLERRARALLERGQLSFDALIERVHAALHGEHGARLAERLHTAWPATLVDEFQDTDPLQYAILDAIHRDESGAPRGLLVMIGDPKQAIYGFRGGDIQAYLRAMASAGARLHLTVNFRSATAYVEALNGLYRHAGPALSQRSQAIEYEPVRAGGHADQAPYTRDGDPLAAPLTLHLHPDPPVKADERRALALRACANAIAELLNDPSRRIDGRPVGPGDIAVLLPKNDDISALRRELAARGVPCVGAGRSSVFRTAIARELQVLLFGIHHADNEGRVRAALATRLYGLDFATLRALDEDADGWRRHVVRLHGWRARWQSEGVLAAVQAIVGHVAGGLLAEATATGATAAEGERALTDLRHLGELLQTRSVLLSGPEELLAWMDRQRRGEDEANGEAAEEMQLRIESDAERVHLMTLHASKGLEFPIVFLPLMWAHAGIPSSLPVVHDDDGIGRVLDLGSPRHAEARQTAAGNDQDERFRVLYVALTRARHACHVLCLPPDRPRDGGTQNPPADPGRSALDAMLARGFERGGRDALAALPGIDWREGPWPAGFTRYRAPADDHAPVLRAREEPPPAPFEFRYSFSALTRQQPSPANEETAAADEAGRDDAPDPAAVPETPRQPHPHLQALEAVKGTRFGNALHAIFEHREIGRPVADQPELVRQALAEFDVREPRLPPDRLAARLAQRIDAALAAELLPGLSLDRLPARALRAEMGFHFPLDGVSMPALRAACAAHGEPDLVPPGRDHTLRGLMTGKIDLTLEHDGRFHVLDYKGNWLGPALADYQGEALARAMDAHHYRFQALLYTLAIDRFLRQRLPDYDRARHLGESLYLFVRAAGLAPGAGVWAHRFDDTLIEAADAVLAGEAGEVAA